MLQSKTFIGDEYKPPPEVEIRYRRVLDEGVAQRTNLFADAHGQFISGIAPVKTEGGAIVALLQVDYSVSLYLQAIAAEDYDHLAPVTS
jgi:hypothetical protein